MNWLYSFRTKNKPDFPGKVCKNYEYYQILLPDKYAKILKYPHGQKSTKLPYGIYVDLNL